MTNDQQTVTSQLANLVTLPLRAMAGLFREESDAAQDGDRWRRELVRVTNELYTAFAGGDLAGLLNTLAVDITWEWVGPPAIPWSGTYEGRDKTEGMIQAVVGATRIQEFQPDDSATWISENNRIATTGIMRAEIVSTGRTFVSNWVHVLTVRDGKVVRMYELNDTAAILEALEK